MGLFYNDSLITSERLDGKQLKRVIQKHLNRSNKYSYVIKSISNNPINGELNIKTLVRGDDHKTKEFVIKNYKIKEC